MTPHVTDGNLKIYKIKCGPYDNNAYVVMCSKTRESIVIDTPAEPGELIAIASTTNVRAILITHNHMDHLLGFEEVTSKISAPVGIGSPDAAALPKEPDFLLENGCEVAAGNELLMPIFTPGGPGKSRSPEALSQLIESIKRNLFTLPQGINFYPGHGDDGSLDASKDDYNIYSSKEHASDLCGDVEWLKS